MNYKIIIILFILFICFLIMCGILAPYVKDENEYDNYISLDLNMSWFNETILYKSKL